MMSMQFKEKSIISKQLNSSTFQDKFPIDRQNRFNEVLKDKEISFEQDKIAVLAYEFECLYHFIKRSTKPANCNVKEIITGFDTKYKNNWIELSNKVSAEVLLDHIQKTVDAYLLIIEHGIVDAETLADFNYEISLFKNNSNYLENFDLGKNKESNSDDEEITALIGFFVDEDPSKATYTNLLNKSNDVEFRKTLLKAITLQVAMAMVNPNDPATLLTVVNLLPEEYKAEPLNFIQNDEKHAYGYILLSISQLKLKLEHAPSSEQQVMVEETKQLEVNETDVVSLPKKAPTKSRFLERVKQEYVDPDTLTIEQRRERFKQMTLNNDSAQTYQKEVKEINTGAEIGSFAKNRALLAAIPMSRPNITNSANVKPLSEDVIKPVANLLNNNNNSNSNNDSGHEQLSIKQRQALLLENMNKKPNSEQPPADLPEIKTKETEIIKLNELNKTYLAEKIEKNKGSYFLTDVWKGCAAGLRTSALDTFKQMLKDIVANKEEKIAFCNEAMKLNIFCDHHENRSNLFGFAVGYNDTNAVKAIRDIKTEIENDKTLDCTV